MERAGQQSGQAQRRLWGHGVILSFKVVGGVVSRYIGQPSAADLIFNVFRSWDCKDEGTGSHEAWGVRWFWCRQFGLVGLWFFLGGVLCKKWGGSVRWWLCRQFHLSTGNGGDQSRVGGHLLSEKPVAASARSSLWRRVFVQEESPF
jgi:hypothetical protein